MSSPPSASACRASSAGLSPAHIVSADIGSGSGRSCASTGSDTSQSSSSSSSMTAAGVAADTTVSGAHPAAKRPRAAAANVPC